MGAQTPMPAAVRYFMGAGSVLIGLVAILAICFHHGDKTDSSGSAVTPETNAVSHPSAPQ